MLPKPPIFCGSTGFDRRLRRLPFRRQRPGPWQALPDRQPRCRTYLPRSRLCAGATPWVYLSGSGQKCYGSQTSAVEKEPRTRTPPFLLVAEKGADECHDEACPTPRHWPHLLTPTTNKRGRVVVNDVEDRLTRSCHRVVTRLSTLGYRSHIRPNNGRSPGVHEST